LDQKVTQVLKVQVVQASVDYKVTQALKVLLDQKAILERKEFRAIAACKGQKAIREFKANVDQKATLALELAQKEL
jgi:hypothetical protein